MKSFTTKLEFLREVHQLAGWDGSFLMVYANKAISWLHQCVRKNTLAGSKTWFLCPGTLLYMQTYTQTHIYAHAYTCTCTYTHIHAHTYTLVYMYTHIYTQTENLGNDDPTLQTISSTHVRIHKKTAGKWRKCESCFAASTRELVAWAGYELGG